MISLCHPVKYGTRLLFCYRSDIKRQIGGYQRMSYSLVSETNSNRVYRQREQVPHGLPDYESVSTKHIKRNTKMWELQL